jgi:hypothetical protein
MSEDEKYYNFCYDEFMSMTDLQFTNYFEYANMDNTEYSAYSQANKDR